MQVETFEVCEVVADDEGAQIDVSEEQLKLIEELELEGQKKLISGDEDDENRQVVPYRQMTTEEAAVYSVICDTHTKVEDYNDAPIPLRVLQVIAHAKSLDFFNEGLRIWHPKGYVKDPVLVGDQKEGYNTHHFILARWGQELAPFADLKKQAAEKFKEKRVAAFEKIAAEVNSHLAAAKQMSPEAHLAAHPSTPYYNGH